MKETKIQWHSAFVSVVGLNFESDRADLILEKEYNLNTKRRNRQGFSATLLSMGVRLLNSAAGSII